MRGDVVDSWKNAIDAAVNVCGSQTALANRLGMAQSNLSATRAGKKAMPKEKIAVLACLLDADPAQLWELQEVANLPRRNPFLQSAAAALSVFLCVVLSLAGNDANAVTKRANPEMAGASNIHIVDILDGVFTDLPPMKFDIFSIDHARLLAHPNRTFAGPSITAPARPPTR
ncbi:hypothetical protein ABT392_16855 [Paucibacter sp. JuS9]|uniref:hypothetical protein n=1 Tax=Paucibacter sp. JuS9 TaxID=3228748 RepID=UPI0037582C9D